MKRVLMTTDTVGGVWSFTLQLAQALNSQGIQVALAALGGLPSDSQRAEAHAIPNLQLIENSFKLEWMDDPWADVEKSGRWLLSLEQSLEPDLIHLNSLVHGDLPWSAPVVLTAHSCVTSWWAAVRGGEAPAEWNPYRSAVGKSLHAAGMVITPTQAMLNALREHFGDLRRVRVVLNGRDPSAFRRGPKEEFILSAGRLWDDAKNVRALADIAPRLSWPVYVAGETRSKDVSPCRQLGPLSAAALFDWYSRASIYALPAHYEPFGLTVLEAALSGCALVLGDIPSLREIWNDAAVFVAPEDRLGLRNAISSLIDSRRRRLDLAHRSYRRALQLSAARMASEYLSVYEQALEAKALCA